MIDKHHSPNASPNIHSTQTDLHNKNPVYMSQNTLKTVNASIFSCLLLSSIIQDTTYCLIDRPFICPQVPDKSVISSKFTGS